jgi:hypothetical protein
MSTLIPEKIYKYQSFNENTKRNLILNSLWLSKPNNFNDVFDCSSLFVSAEKMSVNEWDKLISLQNKIAPNDMYVKLWQNAKNREVIKKINTERVSEFLLRFRDRIGVACFSEIPCYSNVNNEDVSEKNLNPSDFSLVMWSHYAEGSKGFCLEFDTRYGIFEKEKVYLHKIDYTREFISVKPSIMSLEPYNDVEFKQLNDLCMKSITMKSMGWAYEKEWRLINPKKGNHYLKFGDKSLTAVYFGCCMPDDQKSFISQIVGKSIEKYQIEKSKYEFKVYRVKYEG